ncbi:MAG: hypothetical protein QNJ57_01750 [Flavobacteriaceae bacterium]|nr:hypothetical protein [Flavobacteriaceae bacterium]
MSRKIKLIWDFRGPSAQKTAEHHVVHLKDYADVQKITSYKIATQTFSDFHTTAFMIINEKDMIAVRDALRPHRGEVAK